MTDPDRDRIDRMVLMIPDDEHGSEGQHNATQAALGLATIARALLAYKHWAASRITSLEQENEALRAELTACHGVARWI